MTSSAASIADPWQALPAVVTDIRDETPGVSTYCLNLQHDEDANRFSAKPGQFNMLYVPGVGEAAISLSGSPAETDQIIHTVRAVGNVTNALARSIVGTTIGIRGPFGSHWPIESCFGKDIVLVAGGIGLAPLRPVVYQIIDQRDKFREVSLLIGARTPTDLLYASEYNAWRDAEIDVQSTVDRAGTPNDVSSENIGVVTLLLQRLVIDDPPQAVVFTCGPEVMMTYSIQMAIDRGIDPTNIWLSLERNMNCAIGHCGHCQLGPHFICKDGPVLRYDQVDRLMEVATL